MYRIGEFSYLFELTIKTLRYYDDIDLFKPSYKDPFTGYRYYEESQIEELKKILKLKEYGFTLEEIKKMKKELSEEKISIKIKTLEKQQQELNSKIEKLENLKNEGEGKLKYIVGVDSNNKITVVGKRIILAKRNEEEIEKHFNEIESKIKKLKLGTDTKVIITEEVGYKEEDVELFIGFRQVKLNTKIVDKIYKGKKLDIFEFPSSTYLRAINIEKNDIVTACKNIIEYSNAKKFQILGPFIEIYDREGTIDVSVYANDLVREEILEIKNKEKKQKSLNKPFISNKEIVGKWKIKEILPNINFNPNKQKSIPSTVFEYLEINEDGTTNFENLTWSNDTLFIKTEYGVVTNLIRSRKKDNLEYLEIRMNDMTLLHQFAKPYSYIYTRIK